MYDLIIRNSTIIDGSGASGHKGNVVISGDTIRAMAPSIAEPGTREIDAAGKLVIPGLIDPRVHEEWICFSDNRYELFLRQGVTSVVNSNCWHSIFPGPRECLIDYYWGNGLMSSRQSDLYKQTFLEWEDFDGYARAVEAVGTTINFVTLLRHSTIRRTVMHGAHDRMSTEDEDEQIIRQIYAAGRAIIQKDAYIFAGDKSDKFIVLSEDPHLEGRSVQEIAAERGRDADECMLDLLGDDNQYVFWLGGPVRKDFTAGGHVEAILRNPYVSVGTDEILGNPEDPYDWYELQRRGGFPIFMQMYREKGIAVEEIVRRNTFRVARHFGIERRGELKIRGSPTWP